MRRLLLTAGVVIAVVAVALVAFRDGDDDSYLVRAIFDSGSFLVEGEQVRVAGANVGVIQSVDVTLPGEIASYEDGQPQPAAGKAVIVLDITDPGFQDFRSDASCHIRPQSLIGEKFVDCRPTIPRAPGSPPAPPLKEIPSDEPGAGQHLLPLENNSASVDPDLINDIQSLPYAQRFRLIFNELGAGLASRGEDIEEAVKRANPVLRDLDRFLLILRNQRDQLAQLSADSDRILEPLARERTSVAGFFSNAGAAGQASSERGEELEASLRKFPEFLREFRLTMRSLAGFSDAAAPVFADLDKAAPAFTEATRLLKPFSAASTVALKSLGDTGEVAGPKLRAADPIVRKSRDLAKSGASPVTKLAEFFTNTQQTKGWDGLVDLIYNGAATTNGFDEYGHFARTLVTLTNCVDYTVTTQGECDAHFGAVADSSADFSGAALSRFVAEELAREGGGTVAGAPMASPAIPRTSPAPVVPELGDARGLGPKAQPSPPQRALLDYLLGP